MSRIGVTFIALFIGLFLFLNRTSYSQEMSKLSALGELKISFPSSSFTDKTSFTVKSEEKVTIKLDLPVLSGSNKAWIGVINFITKEEIWGTMVDAAKGPQTITEVKTLKPGVYRIIYEFAGELSGAPKAKWSGTISVSH